MIESALMQECPMCRASMGDTILCYRCGVDLTYVRAIECAHGRYLAQARACASLQLFEEALGHAKRAWSLWKTDEARAWVLALEGHV